MNDSGPDHLESLVMDSNTMRTPEATDRLRTIVQHVFRALLVTLLVPQSLMAAGGGNNTGDGKANENVYLAMNGPIVVNLLDKNQIHFLQIAAEFKLEDPTLKPMIEKHMAPIRHELIMLLADVTYREINTVQGKKRLRKNALKAVREVLREKIGKPAIKNIYFTSMVVQ